MRLVLFSDGKKIIADFHVLVLFMAKKHDLSDKKKFRRSCDVATPTASPLKARKLKFWLPKSFGLTGCPLYSEF
jgi:hypothetical protein